MTLVQLTDGVRLPLGRCVSVRGEWHAVRSEQAPATLSMARTVKRRPTKL